MAYQQSDSEALPPFPFTLALVIVKLPHKLSVQLLGVAVNVKVWAQAAPAKANVTEMLYAGLVESILDVSCVVLLDVNPTALMAAFDVVPLPQLAESLG